MYICRDCGFVFEQPHSCVGELVQHFGTPCRQTYAACPLCGSDDFAETAHCPECGSFEEELSGGLCDRCAIDVKKKLDAFFADLSEAEREYVRSEIVL